MLLDHELESGEAGCGAANNRHPGRCNSLRHGQRSAEVRQGYAFAALRQCTVFVGTESFDESEQLIRDLCGAFEVLPRLAWGRCRGIGSPAVEIKLVFDWRTSCSRHFQPLCEGGPLLVCH